MSKPAPPLPRIARARIDVFCDIMLMLADLPTIEDAQNVIAALNRLDSNNTILALFRPCELPSTTRRDLAEKP